MCSYLFCPQTEFWQVQFITFPTLCQSGNAFCQPFHLYRWFLPQRQLQYLYLHDESVQQRLCPLSLSLQTIFCPCAYNKGATSSGWVFPIKGKVGSLKWGKNSMYFSAFSVIAVNMFNVMCDSRTVWIQRMDTSFH